MASNNQDNANLSNGTAKAAVAMPSASGATAVKKPSVVINPYAKRSTTVSNPYANRQPQKPKPQQQQQKQQQQKSKQTNEAKRFRSPPDIGESATFSQAFGDEDFDQDAFNEAMASAHDNSKTTTTNTSNTNAHTNTHETTTNGVGVSLRDHHAMLDSHMLHISTRQRGNPLLAHIKNVPHQFSPMVPDYIFGPTRCALFLSLRYHNLHPDYIHRRIAELKKDFTVRILLCFVDIEDNASALLFLNDLCVKTDLTLLCFWSELEGARYIETLKAFDGTDTSAIETRDHTSQMEQVAHALASVRSVNKTDAGQLLNQFGCWKNIVGASVDELSVCPGLGPKKVRRLYEAFRKPFSREAAKRRKEREKEAKEREGSKNADDDNKQETEGDDKKVSSETK
jgi:DNA excision repair protein ERCC-1